MALINRLREKTGERVFTVEISPPATYTTMVKTSEIVRSLKDLDIDGIAVTNSTGGSFRLNPLAVVDTIRAWLPDIPILIHLTSRDEGSVRSLYTHIGEMGQKRVSDVLVLRGDPTPGHSTETDAYKFTTVELVGLIAAYCRGNGQAVDIFVAGHPEYPSASLGKHLAYQKRKIDQGAQGIIANIVTDALRYGRYVAAARAVGVGVPIVPSLIPLTSLRRCHFLESRLHVPVPEAIKRRLERVPPDDARQVGVEMTIAIALKLLAEGAPGINFNVIFPHDVTSVAEILRAVRGHATIWEKYQIEDPEEIDYYDGLRKWRS